MANLNQNVDTDELINATIIIPQEIIDLMRKKAQKLSFVPLEKAKIVEKNTSNTLYLGLVSALKEIQNIQSRQFEKQRNQPTIIMPPTENVVVEPTTQIIEKQGLVAQIQSKISAKTLALLTQYDLVEDTSINYALTNIEAMIQGVGMQVAPDVTENIAVVNGALYRMNTAAKGSADGGDDETFSTPNMGYIPVQVADFRAVRQKVVCYKAGEVAHIENIMAGEMKERSTRRLQHTEESFSTTTERETTQEKDSQTTERFELQRETQDIINTDISVNGNIATIFR